MELVYLIVVIFGIKHGYKISNFHFKSIQSGFGCIIEMGMNLGFMIMHELGGFLNQICLFVLN